MYRIQRPMIRRCSRNVYNSFQCKYARCLSIGTSNDIPTSASAVIVGGGVIGSSVAYHLSKLGWKNIVMLEQSKVTSGTTWHAAGLIGTSRGTATETRLSVVGTQMYQGLLEETGHNPGYKKCGSLTVARTPDRMIALNRAMAKVLPNPDQDGPRDSR